MIRIVGMIIILNAFLYANSYALVIGVDGGNLIGATNDALAMKKLLHKKGIRNITLLTKTKATKSNIIAKFHKISKLAQEGDRVYLFFSGHGTNANDPSIGRKLQKKLTNTGALQPYGVKKINYNNLVVIKRDLAKYFRKLEKNKVQTVVIFDACYSGSSYKDLYSSISKGSLSLYEKPTRNYSNYPYKHIVYLSASTTLAVASESARKKRGVFSMAITKCLDKNHQLNALRQCINNRNNYRYKATVLPKRKNASLFFKSSKKDIRVQAKPRNIKEQLFDLAENQESFQLYTQDKHNSLTRNYSPKEKLDLFLNNEESGYFVLFMLGAEDEHTYRELQMAYPNNTKMPFIKPSNQKRVELKAKAPFGEEDFVAFFVDEHSAKALQKIFIETSGVLKTESEIKEVMTIIENGQSAGSHFSILSHEM